MKVGKRPLCAILVSSQVFIFSFPHAYERGSSCSPILARVQPPTQKFWIAFTIYLPAALLLLSGFCRGAWRDGHRFLLLGASGSVLSFLSSFLQFMRIGIDSVYFNHNALAHVVQAVALVLLLTGIRYAVSPFFLESRVARAGTLSPSRE